MHPLKNQDFGVSEVDISEKRRSSAASFGCAATSQKYKMLIPTEVAIKSLWHLLRLGTILYLYNIRLVDLTIPFKTPQPCQSIPSSMKAWEVLDLA